MRIERRQLAVLATALALAIGVSAQEKPAPEAPKVIDVAGKWTMSMQMEIGTATPALVFKQAGEKITGTYTGRYGESSLQGALKGKVIEFVVSISAEGTQATMSFKGEVAADAQTMKGDGTIEGLGDVTWTAARAR